MQVSEWNFRDQNIWHPPNIEKKMPKKSMIPYSVEKLTGKHPHSNDSSEDIWNPRK